MRSESHQKNGSKPKLEPTSTPGIYRRHVKGCDREGRCACSYVIVFRDHGRQQTETFATFAEAREGKRTRESAVARGEFSPLAKVTLRDYALEWVDRYQGTGRRGFREETRVEYRAMLEKYALRYFAPRVRLTEISPRMVADFIGWLVKQSNGAKAKRADGTAARRKPGTLSDSSVRNAFKPLSACLATARREGLIRHNPASEAVLPHRPQAEENDERVRPFPLTDDDKPTMEIVVDLIPPTHRLMFRLLAATGVRRSELLALEGRHLRLDGDRPHVQIRQRVRRRSGDGLVIGPLKSQRARRDLPIPLDLADALRTLKCAPDELVFHSPGGKVLDPNNLAKRALAPACSEAGVEWAGFHTFRHTVASRLFAEGRNVVSVQRWLGHHSPSFTLDTYVHLLDDNLGDPLAPAQVNTGSTEGPQTAANALTADAAEAML